MFSSSIASIILAFAAIASYASPVALEHPQSLERRATWTSMGCYLDDGNLRTLTGTTSKSSVMTPALCDTLCNGYTYSGVEFSTTCYCGNTLNRDTPRPSGECNTACGGDSGQMCGGSYRIDLSIYA